MPRIVLSAHKQPIAEFDADELEFARQDGGILLTASGLIKSQDTLLVEELVHGGARCHVAIHKGDETVVDGQFGITVFAFEVDHLVILLH